MCEIQEEILKIISPFSNVYSKCQFKVMQSSKSTWNVYLVSKICPHRSRHHSLLHPLATVRHRTGGGDM